MSWIDTIEKLAPTIATCLGSPVAGMAISALESALGMKSDDIKDSIENNKLNGDQVAAIQTAEINLKAKAQELGLNFEQLATDDRKSARDMQSVTKSTVPAVLSYGITIGFFGILLAIMRDPTVANNQPLLVMLGSLGTAWVAVVTFWFGSTHGSQDKDKMLFNSTPTK